MTMSSFYTKKNQGSDVIFDVTPAPWPKDSSENTFLFGGIVGLVAGIPLTILVIGAFFVIIGIYFIYMHNKIKKIRIEQEKIRAPSSITVSEKTISTDSLSENRENIVEYIYARDDAFQKYVYDIQADQAHFSWSVYLRRSSDSRPLRLVAGLNQDTAKALSRDLAAA